MHQYTKKGIAVAYDDYDDAPSRPAPAPIQKFEVSPISRFPILTSLTSLRSSKLQASFLHPLSRLPVFSP